MICTPAERDLIVAGATQLVVPGDPGCEGCHDRITHAKIHGDAGWVAPQRWVDATGPCPTCRGIRGWRPHPHPELGEVADRCLNCIDGRKREALQVECPLWGAEPIQRHSCRHCDRGYVTFAYATVEVEANDDGRTFTITLSNVEMA